MYVQITPIVELKLIQHHLCVLGRHALLLRPQHATPHHAMQTLDGSITCLHNE